MNASIRTQLKGLNVEIGRHTSGQIRAKCPRCTPGRKRVHRNEVDLSITINDAGDGAVGYCHHCAWSFQIGDKGTVKKSFQKPSYVLDREELDPKALAWFQSRGIPTDVVMRNRIGYGQVWMPQEDKEVGAIAFPYYRNGEVVNVKYRSGKKQFRMEAGSELCLYGLDDIKPPTLIFVEGEMDKLAAETAGILSCVSIPNGAPAMDAKNFERHFSYLGTVDFSTITKFVIAVDGDEPGLRLRDELVRRLGPERCWLVDWPEGCKDANEVLLKHGVDALRALLDSPRPFPISGVVEVRDVALNVMDLYRHGHTLGASPGTEGLKKLYTVKTGQMSVVTGIPSHGKSSWVDWVCYSLARDYGWQFAMCSPENHPVSEHVIKLLELYTGLPFYGAPTERMSPDRIKEGLEWVHDHFTFISPEDTDDWTPKGVLGIGKSLVLRKGIKGIILDPYNEFDHARPNGMSETEYISQTLSHSRNFARSHQVHLWWVAHPFKLKQRENGTYPVPDLYDISGSAHWKNKADMGVTVYREEDHVLIDVQKVRFKHCGQVGAHKMSFNISNNRYEDFKEPF